MRGGPSPASPAEGLVAGTDRAAACLGAPADPAARPSATDAVQAQGCHGVRGECQTAVAAEPADPNVEPGSRAGERARLGVGLVSKINQIDFCCFSGENSRVVSRRRSVSASGSREQACRKALSNPGGTRALSQAADVDVSAAPPSPCSGSSFAQSAAQGAALGRGRAGSALEEVCTRAVAAPAARGPDGPQVRAVAELAVRLAEQHAPALPRMLEVPAARTAEPETYLEMRFETC